MSPPLRSFVSRPRGIHGNEPVFSRRRNNQRTSFGAALFTSIHCVHSNKLVDFCPMCSAWAEHKMNTPNRATKQAVSLFPNYVREQKCFRLSSSPGNMVRSLTFAHEDVRIITKVSSKFLDISFATVHANLQR